MRLAVPLMMVSLSCGTSKSPDHGGGDSDTDADTGVEIQPGHRSIV
jgi:hypothetical protein